MEKLLEIVGAVTVGLLLARGICWASDWFARWLASRRKPRKHVRIVVELHGQPVVDVHAEHLLALQQRFNREKMEHLNLAGVKVFSVVEEE